MQHLILKDVQTFESSIFNEDLINFIKWKNYFLDNRLAYLFEKEERLSFPKVNYHWDSPNAINNCILQLKKDSDIDRIFDQISIAGVCDVQIIISVEFSEADIIKILDYFENTVVKTIEFIIKYSLEFEQINWVTITTKYPRLRRIYLCNYSSNKYMKIGGIYIVYVCQKLNELICGKIHYDYFSTNLPLFTESQHYNTCLNRKVCIDADGNIKNCPAMQHSFGNIKDTTLEEAINKPGFKDMWGIRKDDIDVCKDCEFRYMCTDCRAFIKNPEDIYSQPAKCPYNPYIAKWEGEEGYITVEQWRTENPNWEKKAKRRPLVKKPQSVE